MIASFFKTSRPIHSVIVAVFTFVVFFTIRIETLFNDFKIGLFINEFLKYLIILASIFVLDFLVHKNKLTQKNGYEILIFSLLMITFPTTMVDVNIFTANFFLLLALRRIISLRSNLRIKKKLFDAAFWICIAALFQFWSILFLLLIIAALLLHTIASAKNWIIPLTGVGTVVLIVMAYSILFNDSFGSINNYLEGVSLDFSAYNTSSILVPVLILVLLGLWTLGYYVVSLNNKPKSFRPSFILVLIALFIGLTMILISPNKTSGELIFLFPALTVVLSNYLESINNKWLSEGLVVVLLALPILQLVL